LTRFAEGVRPFAAGAVCATAADLLKWQIALDTGRVLNASSLELARTHTMLNDGTSIDYGLGIRIGSLDGHRVFGHTGSGGGFNAVLESFPDDHLTIEVLMNSRSGAGPSLALGESIARTMLGLPERKTLRDLPVPQEELAALVGFYDSDEGSVENFAGPEDQDAKLHYRLPGTKMEGVMLRQAPNIYAVNANTEVHFLLRSGNPTWAIVYTGGLMMDAKLRARGSSPTVREGAGFHGVALQLKRRHRPRSTNQHDLFSR